MTSPYLVGDLKLEEGLRLEAYPDPISGGPPWTIGYGHTGREVHPGLVWTEAQATAVLEGDIAATSRGLDTALTWWRTLSDLRQDCLVDMAFNLGVHGLMAFDAYLRLVRAGDYQDAAADQLGSRWARQVGHRARRLARQMATNSHQPY